MTLLFKYWKLKQLDTKYILRIHEVHVFNFLNTNVYVL